uniref:Uncharacterized protein n=1 Tax=Candidatus Kentrum sp. DK TaxID=2126562 RepID=A0A450SHQ2_9GAMM|nr:MAG: hypothetical protein BECKDK2373C_GA0170839_103718 [Candidatus Kentron sp. DK]
MRKKRIFLLTGSRLSVYHREKSVAIETRIFRDDHEGRRQFADYLDTDPGAPACLLTDLAEEEFQAESIPHVFGPDRRALMAHRQRRLFPHTPYRYAVRQDRERGGRRGDNVLFAAIPRPDTLERWLLPIAWRRVPLSGICSLALLGEKLLPQLPITSAPGASDYLLLVHCNASGGLRQSFFVRQHLRMSRLASLPECARQEAGPNVAGAILDEVEKTHHYLGSARLLPAGSPLAICFLVTPPMRAALRAAAFDTPDSQYHFVELSGRSVEEFLLPLLPRVGTLNHYAPPNDLRYFRFRQARLPLYATGVALLSAAMIAGLPQLAEWLITERKIDLLEKQDRVQEARYTRAKATRLPELPADTPALKAAVETFDRLQSAKTTPYPLFVAISAALAEDSALEIQSIEWWAPGDPSRTRATTFGEGEPRSPSSVGTASAPFPAQRQSGTKTPVQHQVAVVGGRIKAFSGDYRRATARVEAFAGRLSKFEAVERVDIIERPLDISSEKPLAGNMDTALGGADFTLRVVLRK